MFRFVDRLRDFKAALRNLLKKGKVMVNVEGTECKLLGQMGMCHSIVDITNTDAKIGSKVIINTNPIHIQSSLRREWR